MSPRRALSTVVVLLLAVLTGAGCYTVLRHPSSEPWSDAYSSPGSDGWNRDYYENPGFFYGWTDPYYTSLYGGFPPAWGYYYYHPWTATGPWWVDPWYPWHPWDPDSGAPAPVSGGRHGWERGPGSPSPGTGMPSVPGTRSAPSVGGTPAAPTAPVTPAPDTTGRNERRPDPKRDEENPRRNAWGR